MKTRRRNTKTKTTRKRRSSRGFPIWAGVGLLGLFSALFAGGYLAQVSAVASKGYAIRSLQDEIDTLKEESEKLEFEVAKEKSMVAVEEKVAEMGMVPAGGIEYLSPSEPAVAMR